MVHTNTYVTIAYSCVIGYWRTGLRAAHAVLRELRRTADAAQEGSLLQGEREGGRRRQELRDRADTQKRKKRRLTSGMVFVRTWQAVMLVGDGNRAVRR